MTLLHTAMGQRFTATIFVAKKVQVMENTNPVKSYVDISLQCGVQKSLVSTGLILGVKA